MLALREQKVGKVWNLCENLGDRERRARGMPGRCLMLALREQEIEKDWNLGENLRDRERTCKED